MSDKPETDAVKILHDRYIKGDPERLARLEIEREIADAQQETYDEYVPPLEKQMAELKERLAEVESSLIDSERWRGLERSRASEALAACAAFRKLLEQIQWEGTDPGGYRTCYDCGTWEEDVPDHGKSCRFRVLTANPAGAEHLEVVRAAEELEAFVCKKTPPPRKAEDVKMDYPTEFARLLSVLYEKVRALPGREKV